MSASFQIRRRNFSVWLLAIFLSAAIPAAAQLSSPVPDPLARIREAAKSNVEACSATGETLCEQVAPKIIANAQGDSPLAENLRSVREELSGVTGSTAAARAVAWGLAAFQDAGVEAHVEKFATPDGNLTEQQNVVADIRGREKPEEWVLVGAPLDTFANGPGISDYNCDAAMLIEAARDISRTAIHPRRSLRFVLFADSDQSMPGSWAYAGSHRMELDHASAAIIFRTGCSRMTGFSLNGRHDIENGLREAMKPVASMGADHFDFVAWLRTDNFDFLVEGLPTLTAKEVSAKYTFDTLPAGISSDKIDLADLKYNTAIVAVTAFGVAERATPIGPRQSRAQIASLLKSSGLEREMKTAGLWPLWQSGQRGRLP